MVPHRFPPAVFACSSCGSNELGRNSSGGPSEAGVAGVVAGVVAAATGWSFFGEAIGVRQRAARVENHQVLSLKRPLIMARTCKNQATY